MYNINKANWDLFHHKLDSKINISNLEGKNVEQLEETTKDWIKNVKSAMDVAIPKSSYQHICQLKTTPKIKDLETQFKNLKEFATHFGWTPVT